MEPSLAVTQYWPLFVTTGLLVFTQNGFSGASRIKAVRVWLGAFHCKLGGQQNTSREGAFPGAQGCSGSWGPCLCLAADFRAGSGLWWGEAQRPCLPLPAWPDCVRGSAKAGMLQEASLWSPAGVGERNGDWETASQWHVQAIPLQGPLRSPRTLLCLSLPRGEGLDVESGYCERGALGVGEAGAGSRAGPGSVTMHPHEGGLGPTWVRGSSSAPSQVS